MLQSLTRQFADYSEAGQFAFGFYCDRCGAEWKSVPVGFSAAGFRQPLEEPVRSMLWNQQHKEAYERANNEAMFYFNRCPVCGSWVCDECFHVESSSHTDICKRCREKASAGDA